MSAHEFRTRVAEQTRFRKERRIVASRALEGTLTRANKNSGGLLQRAEVFMPGAQEEAVSRFRGIHEDLWSRWSDTAKERAGRLKTGRYPLFDRSCDLTGEILWNHDPGGDYCWETSFYKELPLYRLPHGVDVKYVWELGRHQFLSELGRDWLMNGTDESAVRAIDLMRSWIEAAPMYQGVHWTSALEVAMRSISWAWTLGFLGRYPGWNSSDLTLIANSLEQHGEYLANHLSYYSSPYNHLIGEAAGLWLISRLVPKAKDADRWSEESIRVLLADGAKQFHSDGFSVEQASSYHFYTLSFLALVQSAAKNLGEDCFTSLRPVIQSATKIARSMQLPDGRMPMIGDADSARVAPVLPCDEWDFRSNLGWIERAFDVDRGGITEPREEAFWTLGPVAEDSPESVRKTAPPSGTCYPESGYLFWHDPVRYLLFDVGPIADGLFSDSTPSTAHGHADQLQVIFYQDGKPISLDVGMPFYGGDPLWTEGARSASSHNTIEIEGTGPVRAGGRLEWSHHARLPGWTAFDLDGTQFLIAEAIWGDARIIRQIAIRPGRGIWIADQVRVTEPKRVAVNWQLLDEAPIPLSDASDTQSEAELTSSVENHWRGWIFPSYGTTQPGKRFTMTIQNTQNCCFLTGLGIERGSVVFEANALRVECSNTPHADMGDRDTGNGDTRDKAQSAGDVSVWRFDDGATDAQEFSFRVPENLSDSRFREANPNLPIGFWSSGKPTGMSNAQAQRIFSSAKTSG